MNLLQNEFIKQLYMSILGLMFFMANCAFILIPATLGSIPGRSAAPGFIPAEIPLAAAAVATVERLALAEYEPGSKIN